MAFPVASFTSAEYQRLTAEGLITEEINRFATNHGLTLNISLAADPMFEPRVDPSGRIVVWYLGGSPTVNGSSIDADIGLTSPLLPGTTKPILESTIMPLPDGFDLRDVQLLSSFEPGLDEPGDSGQVGGALVVATSRLWPLLPVAGRTSLSTWLRALGTGTLLKWDALPGWVKLVLGGVGFSGFDLLFDLPFVDVFPGGGGGGGGFGDVHQQLPGHIGATIIGSWNTNPQDPSKGVTFYRLSDGKLAVQNKRGKWRVWKPKRPVVLYAGGVKNLKTLLKADAILQKESKKLQRMLNRRAPAPRKRKQTEVISIQAPQHPHILTS